MCSLAPVESYVAMYGLMIGGIEISAIGEFSPLVIALFIVATFSGMIVMVSMTICGYSPILFSDSFSEQIAFVGSVRLTF